MRRTCARQHLAASTASPCRRHAGAPRRECCSTGRTTAATPARSRVTRYGVPAARFPRLALGAEDERRARQDAAQRELDAGVEDRARARRAGRTPAGRRLPLRRAAGGRRGAPAVETIASRAGRFVSLAASRPACTRTRRGAARWLRRRRVVRSLDADRLHVRRAFGRVRIVEVAEERLQPRGFERPRRSLRETPRPRSACRPSRAGGRAAASTSISSDVAGRILLQRDEIVVAADGREQNPLAVERQLDLMRILQSPHGAQVGPPQPQLKVVLAVDRKRVRSRQARRACRAAARRGAGPARDPAGRSTCRD